MLYGSACHHQRKDKGYDGLTVQHVRFWGCVRPCWDGQAGGLSHLPGTFCPPMVSIWLVSINCLWDGRADARDLRVDETVQRDSGGGGRQFHAPAGRDSGVRGAERRREKHHGEDRSEE